MKKFLSKIWKKIAKNEDTSGLQLDTGYLFSCGQPLPNVVYEAKRIFILCWQNLLFIRTNSTHRPLSTYKVSLLEIRRLADVFRARSGKALFRGHVRIFPLLYVYVRYLSCVPALYGGYRTTMGAFVLSRLVDFIGTRDRIASRCIHGVVWVGF